MKKLILSLCSLFIISSLCLFSQEGESNAYVPPRLINYKPIYEHTFNKSFIDVWNGIIGYFGKENVSLQTKSKNQDAEGKFKGTIRTDFIILASGSDRDTSYKAMDRISKEPITIRGGIWTSARNTVFNSLKRQSGRNCLHVVERNCKRL